MPESTAGDETANGDLPSHLLPNEEDLLFEEELLRNPYSLKMWWRYLQARKHSPAARRYVMFERALRALPGSYKLWKAYLSERLLAVRGSRPDDAARRAVSNAFERALVSMHKMPRIWLDYLGLLIDMGLLTQTRRVFDRALQNLPVTQHPRIWQLYMELMHKLVSQGHCQPAGAGEREFWDLQKFLQQGEVPEDTALRVYRRYLKLEPTHHEELIAWLKLKERWGEAADQLAVCLNDDTFRSLQGKSKHQMWLELCDIITKHPNAVSGSRSLQVEPIIRAGIRTFTDEVGRLWTSLADYYIRKSMFEKARDIYEEGMTTVVTVRDFSLIFDAFIQFEESMITAQMEQDEDDGKEVDPADDGSSFILNDDGSDIELRLARLEWLMERRPLLLNSVVLRQNPHNVHEWQNRVKLYQGQPEKQIRTFTEAVKTVDPEKAIGKPHSLWCQFARLYERHKDLKNARVIFDKATQARFKYVDDLATVWCEWAETELRNNAFQKALDVVHRATQEPASARQRRSAQEERSLPLQDRVWRSLKVWSMLVDLEESLGTLESTRKVYDRILELRIATPQIILNYALLLQEHKFFEDSFQVYERGVALFKYPHVRDIWLAYTQQFVQRYKGTKLERARDLFEQALHMAPPDSCKPLYLLYAKLEEDYGLAKHAMAVYERAVWAVPREARLEVFKLFVQRASEFFGVGKVREAYEMAIEAEPPHDLPERDCRELCVRYAQLERQLGEIDRARAIFTHASHLADPAQAKDFWEQWNTFEVQHGNEDTFRDMLRIKRSVAASYSQVHYNTSVVEATTAPPIDAGPAATVGQKRAREPGAGPQDDMEALEAAARAATAGTGTAPALSGFVSAGTINANQPQEPAQPSGPVDNPEEIDLDEDDGDDDGEDGAAAGLQQKPVPAAVFGSLSQPAAEDS